MALVDAPGEGVTNAQGDERASAPSSSPQEAAICGVTSPKLRVHGAAPPAVPGAVPMQRPREAGVPGYGGCFHPVKGFRTTERREVTRRRGHREKRARRRRRQRRCRGTTEANRPFEQTLFEGRNLVPSDSLRRPVACSVLQLRRGSPPGSGNSRRMFTNPYRTTQRVSCVEPSHKGETGWRRAGKGSHRCLPRCAGAWRGRPQWRRWRG